MPSASALVVAFAVELGLTPGAALVGGLAFAVHPVHVEAVANVAGRAELLSTSLALLGLCAYARSRLVAAGLLLGAALFAKENVVAILGVIALWEAVRPVSPVGENARNRLRAAALPLTAAVVPIAAYLVARFAVLGGIRLAAGSVTSIENPIVGLPPVAHAATVLAVFGRAASLIVTPIRLSPTTATRRSCLSPRCWRRVRSSEQEFSWADRGHRVYVAARPAGRVSAGIRARHVRDRLERIHPHRHRARRPSAVPSSVFACILFGLAASAAAARSGARAALGAGVVLVALAWRAAAYTSAWRNDATLFEYAARAPHEASAPWEAGAASSWLKAGSTRPVPCSSERLRSRPISSPIA